MTNFHADAVRNRARVSVYHYSDLCPIHSGTEFDSLDAALIEFGPCQLDWNPDRDAVRHSFRLHLFSGTRRTGFDFHADVSFRDHRGRLIKPDVVVQAVGRILCSRRSGSSRFLYQGMRPEDFRLRPVAFTGRGYHAKIRRRIRTTAERLAAAMLEFDEDARELGLKARAKRNFSNLPEYRDDIYRSDWRDNGWKSNRRKQWRVGR